jgi:hypothetical protein
MRSLDPVRRPVGGLDPTGGREVAPRLLDRPGPRPGARALLHRASRPTDDAGRIVATVDDYAIVRQLLLELVSDGVGATVRKETRETVEAVEALKATHENGVPQRAVVQRLEVDKSAVSRRVRVALEAGYLVNLEERRGRPHRLDLGEPLPDELEILPAPEDLDSSCTVAQLPGGEAGSW